MGSRITPTLPNFIAIHVPQFPAQALLRLRPELRPGPVVVLQGDPPLDQVCSANRLAQRLGVRPGMTRAELDSFRGLSILRRSPAEERIAQAAILEAAGTFTPRIELHPTRPPAWSFVLDMAGTSRLFGSVEQSARRILHTLQQRHISAHLAASANQHAAACMASATTARITVLSAGTETSRLAPLPLSTLHLTPQQTEAFALWGLHTLGDLAALPEVDLIVRLGQPGKRLRLLARGEHPHLMVPEEPAFLLEEFLELDCPEDRLDALLFLLGPMLDQLLTRAQNRSYALASLTVKLGLDGGGEHTRTIKPALPVLQRDVLLKLLHLDLQAHPPEAGVLSLHVHAEPGDRSKVQMGLFAPPLPEPLRLDITLARIAALVGEDRVGRPALLDTHRPDAFTMQRFVVTGLPKPKPATNPRPTLALRRCRPPVGLTVQHQDHRLVTFSLQGKRYTVQQAFGPWRRSGDWWTADLWSHEEWDVRAALDSKNATDPDDVLVCLLSHDLLRHRWQLEALYD